jgi:hypothetical protein
MGRAERRRAEREQRRRLQPASNIPGWSPPENRLVSATWVPTTPEETERQQQDFLAGTVFAAGAGHLFPTGGDGTPPMVPVMFVVYVQEDEATFGPAPQLREAFALLDQHGGVKLHELLTVGTAWAALDGTNPLVKLKLEFHEPIRGKTAVVLVAENYRDSWHHIVGGGVVAVTTPDRMHRVNSRPDATSADAPDASILLGIGSSPVIKHLIDTHRW